MKLWCAFPTFMVMQEEFRILFGLNYGRNTNMKIIFSRVLRDSTTRFVGPSVGPSVRPSVGPSHFTFFGFLRSLALLLLPK